MIEKREYILITAAHNEQDYIEKTIKSVINQKLKPVEWIIVNDASNDKTEEIVRNYLPNYSFIKLINNLQSDGRNFASKVFALNLGLKNISHKGYNYLGILDADVSFEPDFYEKLISELENEQNLGIVGGIYFDIINEKKKFIKPVPYSIRGATQFFRRKCFEDIGGLIPLKYGGEDALSCYAARMCGWQLKNIRSAVVLHHRQTGKAEPNIFIKRFKDGIMEFSLGYHPLFQTLKCLRRVFHKPIFIGSVLQFFGYWYSKILNNDNFVSKELKNFIRKDQINNLFSFLFLADRKEL